MSSNRCSPEGRERPPGSHRTGWRRWRRSWMTWAAQDLAGLPDAVRAERLLVLRRLLDRLEGQWLGELAGVDGCGAAGAEQGIQAASTAGWLRGRLRMGAGAAGSLVRTARALFTHPTDDNRPWSEPAAGAASCRCPAAHSHPPCPVGAWGPNNPDPGARREDGAQGPRPTLPASA